MKRNKLTAFLTAAVLGTTAILPAEIHAADTAPEAPAAVSEDEICALSCFLRGESLPEDIAIPDMDENGVLNAVDLTLVKQAYLKATPGIFLQNLRADIADILLYEEQTVTFTVSVQGADAVSLYDSEYEEPVAVMHDDGRDGDVAANDGIYSAQLELMSEEIKRTDYYAAAGISESNRYRISFYRDLTEEEFLGFTALQETFAEIETMEEANVFAEQSEEITWFGADEENGSILFETVYHITGFWEETSQEEGILGTGKYAVPEIDGFNYDEAEVMIKSCKFTPAHPDKRDVIVIAPYHNYEDKSERLDSTNYFRAGDLIAEALDSDVTIVTNQDADLEVMKNLSGYGTVLINAHGGYWNDKRDSRDTEVLIMTIGVSFDSSAFQRDPQYFYTYKEYSKDFFAGRITGTGHNRIGLTPDFFDYYYPEGSLEDSFWYLSCCHSLQSTVMADTLVQKGAGAVLGFSNTVKVFYSAEVLFEAVINCMILSAQNVFLSMNSALNRSGPNRFFKYTTVPCMAGDRFFRLVNQIEPVEKPLPEEDEGSFKEDNSMSLQLCVGTNSILYYKVSGHAGNVNVTIPSYVQGIPVKQISGFAGRKHLRSIRIPSTVTEIPDNAFASCPRLETVHFSPNTARIGDHAFEYCGRLRTALIPSGCTEIGDLAFRACTSLSSVSLPEALETIGEYAFDSCTSLSEISIPSGVTSIGKAAFGSSGLKSFELNLDNPLDELSITFQCCQKLESVSLRSPVESLSFTFVKCPSLAHVELPDGLKTISGAFCDTTLLREIEIPDGVEKIDSFSFQYCRCLEELILPDSVTYLGQDAASYNPNLKTVVLSSEIKEIGTKAFYSCSALTEVQLPQNLEKIGEKAFAYCPELKQITLPDSLKLIGYDAFWDCICMKISDKLPPCLEEVREGAFYRCHFVFENWQYPYLSLPASMQKMNLLAFESSNVSALIVNNPDMEFTDPFNDVSGFKRMAKNLTLYGYEGSTAQAFAENPDHPSTFIPIQECPLIQ